MLAKFFRIPFANAGTKTAIPDPVQGSGAVSYTEGFGNPYQLAKTDPNSRNIERDKFNELLYDVTAEIQDYQTHGFPPFISTADNGGVAYSYDQYAIVRYLGAVYMSMKAANTSLPNVANDWVRMSAFPVGASRVMGLTGSNNNGTPNTQFDIAASAVTVRNPTTGETVTVSPQTTLTNNAANAGPAANGRDQAGAFAASNWLHFYFIFNPTTGAMATISSLTAPTTGPAMPTGFTMWAYAGAVYWTAGSILTSTAMRGAWATYRNAPAVVTTGTASTPTAVSVASSVPPNALEMKINVARVATISTGGGAYAVTVTLSEISGGIPYYAGIEGQGGAGVAFGSSGGQTILPNVGQQFYYNITTGAGSSSATNLAMAGYKMPNGGE